MKRTAKGVAGLLAALLAAGGYVWSQAARTEIFWTYDSKTDPPCSAALTTNCIAEFDVGILYGTRTSKMKLPHDATPCPTPTPAAPVNCVDQSGIFYGVVKIADLGSLPYGPVLVDVFAAGFDNTGQPIQSVSRQTSFINLPRPVANLGTR